MREASAPSTSSGRGGPPWSGTVLADTPDEREGDSCNGEPVGSYMPGSSVPGNGTDFSPFSRSMMADREGGAGGGRLAGIGG